MLYALVCRKNNEGKALQLVPLRNERRAIAVFDLPDLTNEKAILRAYRTGLRRAKRLGHWQSKTYILETIQEAYNAGMQRGLVSLRREQARLPSSNDL